MRRYRMRLSVVSTLVPMQGVSSHGCGAEPVASLGVSRHLKSRRFPTMVTRISRQKMKYATIRPNAVKSLTGICHSSHRLYPSCRGNACRYFRYSQRGSAPQKDETAPKSDPRLEDFGKLIKDEYAVLREQYGAWIGYSLMDCLVRKRSNDPFFYLSQRLRSIQLSLRMAC